MRTSGGAQVLVAVALLVLSLSPMVVQPSPSDALESSTAIEPRPGIESMIRGPLNDDRYFNDQSAGGDGPTPSTVDQDVQIVATLKKNAQVSDALRRKYGKIYKRQGTRRISATVSLSGIREFSSSPSVRTVYIQNRPNIEDRFTADGVAKTGIEELHERGMTGDGMTVGVIGSGFRMTHPSIADQVWAYQRFSDPGPQVHGTAVASVVADTAPESKLHLAAVGSRTNPAEYEKAVDWLVESGADVIVDSGSYFGQPGDGTGPISQIASGVPEDVTFVTSAGNYAQRHWQGVDHPADGTERVTFEEGRTKNYVDGGRTVSGRISLGLHWNGSTDYDLYLYRETPAGDWIWQSSETGGDAEKISISVPKGQYYVAIEHNGTAAAPEAVELSLFANRRLQHRSSNGSLTAPATAPGVVAVGAVDGREVAPFSSRGPVPGDSLGVDLVAPDDAKISGVSVGEGTSFAAPYVAGTVALLRAEYPELSSEEVVRAIQASAVDVGVAGADPASGHGLLDAIAAAERAQRMVAGERESKDAIA